MLVWVRDSNALLFIGDSIRVTCDVRSIKNGRRAITEKPVRTENRDGSDGVPYDPLPFPRGCWKVTAIIPKTDPYMAPFFIATDATQRVYEWTEVQGHYGVLSGRMVADYGYGLHCSTSSTTLGCGRIESLEGLMRLKEYIEEEWQQNREVSLIVR